MLVIHWCPDGGWEAGKRFTCTDRHPGNTYLLRHISIFQRLLRVIEFLCIISVFFLCMQSKGFSCIDCICIKEKEPECGLILTSDCHIHQCNPGLVIVWFCSGTGVELSLRLNLPGLGEMWDLIPSKWNHWEAKQTLINCLYSSVG